MATRKRSSYARRDIKEPTRDDARGRRKNGQPFIEKGALDDMEKRLTAYLAGGEKAVTAAGVNDETERTITSPFYRKKQDKLTDQSLHITLVRAMVDHLRREGTITVRKVDEDAWANVVNGCDEDGH